MNRSRLVADQGHHRTTGSSGPFVELMFAPAFACSSQIPSLAAPNTLIGGSTAHKIPMMNRFPVRTPSHRKQMAKYSLRGVIP